MRIGLYLSGRWEPSIADALTLTEILCAPGLSIVGAGQKAIQIKRLPTPCERMVCGAVVDLIDSVEDNIMRRYVEAFINDYYRYSLRALAEVISSVKEACEVRGATEIAIFAAESRSHHLPMMGIKTTETRWGSANLLYSRIAQNLPQIFPSVQFTFVKLRGDLLCNEWARQAILRGISASLTAGLAARCLVARIQEGFFGSSVRGGSVVLIRAKHQLRFAARLLNKADNAPVSALFIPQLSQGSSWGLQREINKNLPNVVGRYNVTIGSLFGAIVRSWRDKSHMRGVSKGCTTKYVEVAGLKIPVRLGDIADELRVMGIFIVYKNLLSSILRRHGADRLINFEMCGRMAGLEAAAARECGIVVSSVQTALISSDPQPIFPFSDQFYADSISTAEMIARLGSKSFGEVLYGGPPYPVLSIREAERIQQVAFFTQPYEPKVTGQLVEALCQWGTQFNGKIVIKIHPRDHVDRYRRFLPIYSEVLRIEERASAADIISTVDVCVTRTSSVAKEALAMGTPILLCPWSAFDRAVKADYLLQGGEGENCCFTKEQFFAFLNDPSRLATSARLLQARMFGSKDCSTLAAILRLQT